MEKRTSNASSKKIRGSRKPRAPRRAKRQTTRAKQAKTQAGNRVHDRAPMTQHGRPTSNVARPGRAGWHDHATWHGRARSVPARRSFRDFRPFLYAVFLHVWRPFSTSLRTYFRVELGFILDLNKFH